MNDSSLVETASGWAVYHFLGMEVGLVQNGMRQPQRIPAYKADVTYGTNAEFGFDYLRDNMVTRASAVCSAAIGLRHRRRGRLILIDEARTPLIISGAGVKAADTYKKFSPGDVRSSSRRRL